jgi:predicted RNase H-like HicB family nuclease
MDSWSALELGWALWCAHQNEQKGTDTMRLQIKICENEHGGFLASCPMLPGCVSHGETRDEARESMDEAIRGYLASVCNFVPENIADQVVVEV